MPVPWMPGADFGVSPLPNAPNYSSIFSSPASAAGGGGFGWGQLAGVQGLANLGLNMMGMSNAGRSAQSAFDAAGIMSDINMGKDLFAINKDIFEQKDAPRWIAQFSVNDPYYRQQQTRQTLLNPGLAGRYSNWAA